MAAFSLRLDLAMEVNRHFFENECVTYIFFLLNFSMLVKYGPILSVAWQETIVENVN